MRLQLALSGLLVGLLGAQVAHADGALSMRGVYYKERSTRVVQPMLDGMFDAGTRGIVTGHLLFDAITSASASSGAAAAEPFTENRYEGGLGYAHEFDGPEETIIDLIRVAADGKYSQEPDYRSIYFGARAEAELAQKNATVSLGGGFARDTINNEGLQSAMGGPELLCDNDDPDSLAKECPLNTYALYSSASHLLSRDSLIGLSYDIAKNSGYTSNAYRQAITTTGPVAERHPNERLRQAVAMSARFYWRRARAAFIGTYRFYWDDWDIHAHTPEVRIVQDVGSAAEASIRYRYYRQDAAFFWERRYGDAMGLPFVTDDPKMSPYDGHLLEAKLGILGETFGLEGRWGAARLEGILEYIIQNNRFGNAVVAHAAITVPFEY
ncbi:MAG TPA: DUF3570 domain-containing protein [Kofleriaceae bacterium]